MSRINLDRVNHFALRQQHLTDDSRIDDIIQIAKDIVGLHATSTTTPYLALYARTHHFGKEHLDEELYLKRNLAKIRCMRKTLYILPKEMLPLAYAATGKMAREASRRYAEFRGVSPEKYEVMSKSVLALLKGREMSVFEVKKALKPQVDVASLLSLMCDQGLLVRGRRGKGWKDKNHKYALFREYFPDVDLARIDETEARTLLLQYYLHSFGPVTENDIVWWIGLTKAAVRKALGDIRGQLVQVEIDEIGGGFIMLGSDWDIMKNIGPFKRPTVNLLPSLDPYLMGYRQRERYLELENYDRIFDRSGNAVSSIMLNGRVVGVWDFEEDAEPTVKIFLFNEVEKGVLKGIHSRAQQVGEFIADRKVRTKLCDSMIPLTSRPAGMVMSPLKGC
jgi:hypothetical protein